jgi:signal transduction histidine kinase
MHGYTLEELRQLPANAYIHPDHYHVLDGYLRTVRAGGIFHARSMHLRKDGTAFHVEVHGTPFTYHGEPHVLGVVRDVTEQVQAYQMLERRVEERTRELSLLLEVSHNMASTLELEPLLGLILAQLKEVVDYLDANVLKLDGGDLIVLGYWGTFDASTMIGRRFAVANASANRRVIERREPVIIADIWDDSPLAESFRKVGMADLDNSHAHIGSWMGVPLMQKEQVIGMLGLGHVQPHYYTPRHARLALAIATQAAVAIENARLYGAAQEIAALRERQRLARDLHDSVSQALYGISLGAHTARTLLERDPARAAQPIDYVLTLAEAGLAEMRALIFELRPESLQAEGLVAAINHQLAALSARHGIGVQASLGEEPDVPLGVKEAIYRILQEALHNTVKHARAANVRISLASNASGLEVEVQDDGIGFNANGDFPGHLGLQSMKERAAGFGGTLRVESEPGKGTKVHARVPRRG